MLPVYILSVDITASDATICEEKFREQVAPSLAHLDGLKGSFDRSPCTITYYPPGAQDEILAWSARGVVLVSLGKKRSEYLLHLYKSIVRLITLELPHLVVTAQIDKYGIS